MKAIKKCRVCGKSYETCHTKSRNPNVFYWQEVACSPECGQEYLRQITESRKKSVEKTETANIMSESDAQHGLV